MQFLHYFWHHPINLHPSFFSDAINVLEKTINDLTDFGDAGRSLPDIHLLVGARIINLAGLAEVEQAIALAKVELEYFDKNEMIVIIAAIK